jgi:uncharacterized protein
MKILPRAALVLALLFATPLTFILAQEKKYEMTTFQMALIRRGPFWTDKMTPELEQLHQQHVDHLVKLGAAGQILTLGAVGEQGDLRGIIVLGVDSPAEAKKLIDADPAVKAGHLAAEIHPWYAAKGIMKFAEPVELSTYYLTFLKRGPKWTAAETPETTKLQAAHMANIQKMAADGKLVIAGPFADDGDLRGVFVFRVGSIEEAKGLSDADPAVKAGRLVSETHQWMVPKGSLP